MKNYNPMISEIDTTSLVKFNSLEEFEKYTDLHFVNNVESIKLLIGSQVYQDIEAILKKMMEGDKFVYIISPEWTWDCLAGSAGYGIMRNKEIVFSEMCIMS